MTFCDWLLSLRIMFSGFIHFMSHFEAYLSSCLCRGLKGKRRLGKSLSYSVGWGKWGRKGMVVYLELHWLSRQFAELK